MEPYIDMSLSAKDLAHMQIALREYHAKYHMCGEQGGRVEILLGEVGLGLKKLKEQQGVKDDRNQTGRE